MYYRSPLKISMLFPLFGLLFFGVTLTAAAQTFIEPPAAPPGGNVASWITTTTRSERKLGSLSIGTNSNAASLCLNAVNAVDAAHCISGWNQVINLAGGPFVALRTVGLSVAEQSAPTNYFLRPTQNSGDLGSVTIQATGASQAISLIAEANSGIASGAYGLFASDGGNTNSYAAYFDGKVGIEKTVLVSGLPGPVGQLCLNSTSAYTNGAQSGCISAWSELVGGLVNYVRLQSATPPSADAGTAGVSEVGNFGAVIVGDAPTGQTTQTFCGDGQCSAHLNENISSDANYCPIDCVAPLQPLQLAEITPTATTNRMVIRGQTQVPSGNYYLLLVQSPNPTFITDLKTEFVPQNGVTYTQGSVINGVKIVSVRLSSGSAAINVSDTALTTNATYFYRLYQANLFPIYNSVPLTLQMTTTDACPDTLPPNQVCA